MKNIEKFLKSHASLILTVLSGAGVIFTAVSAVKATKRNEEELKECDNDDLVPMIYVKNYAPTVLIGVGTIFCMASAHVLDRNAQALLSSAYILADQNYKEYSGKVREIFGEDAHKQVCDAVALSHCDDVVIQGSAMMSNVCLDSLELEITHIFYDEFSRRFFPSTMSKVLQAEYHLNRNYSLGASPTVNDWYDFLGISHIEAGDEYDWDDLYENGIIWIDFDHSVMELNDGKKAIRIIMVWPPQIYREVC